MPAACGGLRQDLRKQVAGPLQTACRRSAKRRLHLQCFFLQKGRQCRRRGRVVIKRLRQVGSRLDEDRQGIVLLVRALRSAWPGAILSLAAFASDWYGKAIDVEELMKDVDFQIGRASCRERV